MNIFVFVDSSRQEQAAENNRQNSKNNRSDNIKRIFRARCIKSKRYDCYNRAY